MMSEVVKTHDEPRSQTAKPLPRVCFLVEGNVDIRILLGLTQICELTLIVPSRNFEESQLKERIERENLKVDLHPIAWGTLKIPI